MCVYFKLFISVQLFI